MIQRLLPYLSLACFLCLGVAILRPLPNRSYLNARRVRCQSNLKQIGLALQQYAQDYDEHLPLRRWETPLLDYTKESIFQCPSAETNATGETGDYFFNNRFLGEPLGKITSPNTLIFVGDGLDNATDATLFSLPTRWRTVRDSPAWRHLDGANYSFADGHVKWLKVNRVNRDFRVVSR